jgi:hypothetical protein
MPKLKKLKGLRNMRMFPGLLRCIAKREKLLRWRKKMYKPVPTVRVGGFRWHSVLLLILYISTLLQTYYLIQSHKRLKISKMRPRDSVDCRKHTLTTQRRSLKTHHHGPCSTIVNSQGAFISWVSLFFVLFIFF